MTTESGIGGTGYNEHASFDSLDNFQSELHFWDDLLTDLRKREVVQD